MFRGSLWARYIVDGAYRSLDWALGLLIFFCLFLLSFIQVVDWAQGMLLYNMRFAKELARGRLLEANYLNSYMDRAQERITKQLKEDIAREKGA